MIDALLRAVLTRVENETPHPPDPPPLPHENDVEVTNWNGLLEFSVLENGSYPAAVPFMGIQAPFGAIAHPDLLTYDGVGGYCGAGTPPATIDIRVSVSGLDLGGNLVMGSATATFSHPGTDSPHPPPVPCAVIVLVENPVRKRKARLWFYFDVVTTC